MDMATEKRQTKWDRKCNARHWRRAGCRRDDSNLLDVIVTAAKAAEKLDWPQGLRKISISEILGLLAKNLNALRWYDDMILDPEGPKEPL